MKLNKLSVINFKNLAQEEIHLGEGINCFVGDNGTCKTNIIDAVYYLSMCKSSLSMSDAQCVRHGEGFFVVEGEYSGAEGWRRTVSCSYTRGAAKVMKCNGKAYERLADHVGLIPAVIVSPADSALVLDAAEERRRYLNGFISQLDNEYLTAMIRYNATLAERNKFLKFSSDEQMLSIYDMQMAASGAKIHAMRADIVAQMQPLVEECYRALSGDREQVELSYRSELNERPMEEILAASRDRDIVNGFTTAGIHRDDLLFRIGGLPLRKYGSQGQQKSFLIALKIAQYRIISRRLGRKPLLLLDDLFDKLDEGRVAELLKIVSGDDFGQIIITDCNRERIERLVGATGCAHRIFNVTYGRVEQ